MLLIYYTFALAEYFTLLSDGQRIDTAHGASLDEIQTGDAEGPPG